MNSVRTWCRALGEGTDAEPVLAGLRRCAVDIELGAPSVHAPGVLVCSGAVPELRAGIAMVTSTGARVVAVVAGLERVPPDTLRELIGAGAGDAVAWRDDVAATVAGRLRRWAEVDALVCSADVRERLVGESPAWQRLLRDLVEASRYSTANVLLLGESGTGKEQAARLVHTLDPVRCTGPFVVADCSALVPELAGSEFFGHERGAFTGAAMQREGAFALAHGGTLFLDEVGELPAAAQAQLLRVVQEGTFKRVGGNDWVGVDVRLVAATNRDLRADVDAGRFRRDLFHRLAGWVSRLPSLRERRSDLLLLARHFAAVRPGAAGDVRFDPAVEQFLLQRDYPGNVRDLRQLVQQLRDRHAGPDPITIGAVPEWERGDAGAARGEACDDEALGQWVELAVRSGLGLKEIGRRVEAAAIQCAYRGAGSYRRVAEQLGVSERTVHGRMAETRRSADQSS